MREMYQTFYFFAAPAEEALPQWTVNSVCSLSSVVSLKFNFLFMITALSYCFNIKECILDLPQVIILVEDTLLCDSSPHNCIHQLKSQISSFTLGGIFAIVFIVYKEMYLCLCTVKERLQTCMCKNFLERINLKEKNGENWCYDAQPNENRDSAAPGCRRMSQECSEKQ